MKSVRKIAHIDMDAFFASVEQRDNPEYRGRALIVGGQPDTRGVVAAASYEARTYGIRSAMSCARAYRLCPDAIFVKPRIGVYRRVSKAIMALLREHTDLVEPLSLDEAFMDLTSNKKGLRYASKVATEVRKKIFAQTGLTASAGVAPNKFLAKIASDINKPNGMKVILPEEVPDFLRTLPIRKIPGVGKVTEEKMLRMGIPSVGHLERKTKDELVKAFGKQGSWYYEIARGIDNRPVIPHRERKSIGAEDTFVEDTLDVALITEKIQKHVEKTVLRLRKSCKLARTVSLKVKYADFSLITRSTSLTHGTDDLDKISNAAIALMALTDIGKRPVRLIGVALSNLKDEGVETSPLIVEQQLGFEF
ncbi:DNA polymerase IV [Oligoflexia bacterium]|nr:DNA polymerase IV [Oligoflexia bacterium]